MECQLLQTPSRHCPQPQGRAPARAKMWFGVSSAFFTFWPSREKKNFSLNLVFPTSKLWNFPLYSPSLHFQQCNHAQELWGLVEQKDPGLNHVFYNASLFKVSLKVKPNLPLQTRLSSREEKREMCEVLLGDNFQTTTWLQLGPVAPTLSHRGDQPCSWWWWWWWFVVYLLLWDRTRI